MNTTVVVPSIDPAYTRDCIETMRFVEPGSVPDIRHNAGTDIAVVNGKNWTHGRPDDQLVVVFNTPRHNLGVAASWNVGIHQMYEASNDWLVICSAAVRFGPAGGEDFLRELVDWDTGRFERHGICALEADGGLGWHLIAFHRSVFERVGYFDENFWPAYHEDNDFSYRIQLAYDVDSRAPDFVGPLWPKVAVDARLDQVAHGIKRGGVTVDLVALEQYYARKWGGTSTNETLTSPFGTTHPVSWWKDPARPQTITAEPAR